MTSRCVKNDEARFQIATYTNRELWDYIGELSVSNNMSKSKVIEEIILDYKKREGEEEIDGNQQQSNNANSVL